MSAIIEKKYNCYNSTPKQPEIAPEASVPRGNLHRILSSTHLSLPIKSAKALIIAILEINSIISHLPAPKTASLSASRSGGGAGGGDR